MFALRYADIAVVRIAVMRGGRPSFVGVRGNVVALCALVGAQQTGIIKLWVCRVERLTRGWSMCSAATRSTGRLNHIVVALPRDRSRVTISALHHLPMIQCWVLQARH